MSEHATEQAQEGQVTEQDFINSLPTGEEQFVNTPVAETTAAEKAASEDEGTPADAASDPLELPDSFTPQDVRGMLAAIDDPAAKAAAEAAVRNFQADYTKSKQQLSEQAQQFSGLDDLEKARAAVEFYDGIQNDPEFAMEVHGYLSQAFEQMGMTPQEAATAATDELSTPAQAASEEAPSFDDDPDAATKARLDTMQQRLDQWEQQDAMRRQQQAEDELAAELLRQEMAIRTQYPTLEDEDMDAIYDLAMARGGNLLSAHQALVERDQKVIERYMGDKQMSQPPVEPSPASGVTAPETPRKSDGSVDLEAVHQAAMQTLMSTIAGRD